MKYILRDSKESFTGVCNYLIDELQFNDYPLGEGATSITSIKEILFSLIRNFFKILFTRKKLNNAELIFSIGYLTLILLFFKKLRLIKFNKIFWWGFFFHNVKVLPYMKRILKFLSDDSLHYIIHSEFEKEIYSKDLGIDKSKLHYFPYGSWNSDQELMDNDPIEEEDYYFSGGYSNRDYISLINAFRKIDKKLIIICSKNNKELQDIDIPANVTVYRDLPSNQFEEFLQKSKAVIIPFLYNSGASGMSVMLRCMSNKKLVVVTQTDALDGYLDNKISGYIMQDLSNELPDIIKEIEESPKMCKELKENLYSHYMKVFSTKAIKPQLSNLLSI